MRIILVGLKAELTGTGGAELGNMALSLGPKRKP